MKYILLVLFLFSSQLFAIDLSSFEKTCAEVGFKPKTTDYGDCVLELRSRELKKISKSKVGKSNIEHSLTSAQISPSRPVEVGDGSNNDNICQKYGFEVGNEGYKKCRLDLDIAQRQAEAQMAQFDYQKKQYEIQKTQYEARLKAEHDEKEMKAGVNILMYGLGLAGGRTRDEAAPALYGLPMYPRQPAPTTVNIAPPISRPGQNMRCDYDYYTKLMRCN
jgi:hypothetical protein